MQTIKQQSINRIRTFLEVLENQKALFSEAIDDLSQLAQTIETFAADQFEEMASAVRAFLKKYPPIRDRVLESNRGAGGGSPVENTPKDEKTLQNQLLNEIRVNTPPPSKKPNQDEGNQLKR